MHGHGAAIGPRCSPQGRPRRFTEWHRNAAKSSSSTIENLQLVTLKTALRELSAPPCGYTERGAPNRWMEDSITMMPSGTVVKPSIRTKRLKRNWKCVICNCGCSSNNINYCIRRIFYFYISSLHFIPVLFLIGSTKWHYFPTQNNRKCSPQNKSLLFYLFSTSTPMWNICTDLPKWQEL